MMRKYIALHIKCAAAVSIHEMGYEIYSVLKLGSALNTVYIHKILKAQEPTTETIMGTSEFPSPRITPQPSSINPHRKYVALTMLIRTMPIEIALSLPGA